MIVSLDYKNISLKEEKLIFSPDFQIDLILIITSTTIFQFYLFHLRVWRFERLSNWPMFRVPALGFESRSLMINQRYVYCVRPPL